ncbi:MAG: hypothetical protein U1E65_31825 [Myxococcota bacterium]
MGWSLVLVLGCSRGTTGGLASPPTQEIHVRGVARDWLDETIRRPAELWDAFELYYADGDAPWVLFSDPGRRTSTSEHLFEGAPIAAHYLVYARARFPWPATAWIFQGNVLEILSAEVPPTVDTDVALHLEGLLSEDRDGFFGHDVLEGWAHRFPVILQLPGGALAPALQGPGRYRGAELHEEPLTLVTRSSSITATSTESWPRAKLVVDAVSVMKKDILELSGAFVPVTNDVVDFPRGSDDDVDQWLEPGFEVTHDELIASAVAGYQRFGRAAVTLYDSNVRLRGARLHLPRERDPHTTTFDRFIVAADATGAHRSGEQTWTADRALRPIPRVESFAIEASSAGRRLSWELRPSDGHRSYGVAIYGDSGSGDEMLLEIWGADEHLWIPAGKVDANARRVLLDVFDQDPEDDALSSRGSIDIAWR